MSTNVYVHRGTETHVKTRGGMVTIFHLPTPTGIPITEAAAMQITEAAAEILIGQLQRALDRVRASRLVLDGPYDERES